VQCPLPILNLNEHCITICRRYAVGEHEFVDGPAVEAVASSIGADVRARREGKAIAIALEKLEEVVYYAIYSIQCIYTMVGEKYNCHAALDERGMFIDCLANYHD
jgi:hypothetical protein